MNMKNKKKRPRISVIIMTRETPFMILKRCIRCVQSQTLQNIEIILLDANEKGNAFQQAISSEGELLRDVTYLYYPEEGEMVHGKNLALEKASADYITFISAQDFMPETRLETILHRFQESSLHSVYYTGMTSQVDNTLENNDYTLPTGKYKYLAQAVFHRSAFEMVGGFDENMLCLCDEDLWMRIEFFKLAGCIMETEAAISISEEAYQNHTPLDAAIAYRQMLVKYPQHFRRHRALKRMVMRNIAGNYRAAHAVSRYLQFHFKEMFFK